MIFRRDVLSGEISNIHVIFEFGLKGYDFNPKFEDIVGKINKNLHLDVEFWHIAC